MPATSDNQLSPADQATPVRTGLYIGGEEIHTEDEIVVHDPARPARVVGRAASASAAHVQSAIASAKDAQVAWAALGAQERARLMGEAIAGIADDRDEDARILSEENGKPTVESWVDALVFEQRWREAMALADQVDSTTVLPTTDTIPTELTISYRPLGVVSIIVPYNWPLAILAAGLPQALVAGNTVVVKPPLTTPLATTRVVRRVAEKLPAGVLNVVTGENEPMSALIESDDVAKLTFTGSVGGGKKMQEMASRGLTRTTLELGGNDAALILDDAILDDTHLDRLFHSIYDSTGQICMNAKRLYVHRSRMDEVVAGLSARLEQVVLGAGTDEGTTMGPLHTARQRDFVAELIAEARESGAEVFEFGELPDGELAEGYFLRPALVVDPDESLRVVTEEQFGPVIPIVPVDSDEEAVAKANDSWAALDGSVWSADLDRARRVAARVYAGHVWINDHGAARLDNRAPFGGFKYSGFGREMGIQGVRGFQDTHTIAELDESMV
ncbi:aldehyde dehydrogenase family protein [Brevibacterium litoralis]|uniref:aldehyde dehydrogenase family protein n=1 Tax=Brevibacterium litoralis TaxID=3138935 RepID=UPI0032F009B8